ncbi:MAG: DUF2889 domain-containing protein [Rhizorhabdus sp.]|uniref:DUF2889 domain-containing protein n=1 Tax=Rhizorhabdus sp. TaxID=1968843 RepID=UPI001B6062D1|nr:DUF2889 domain-containing protein [Rhizorhabdus sp.]MBP8232158.1 DUF2889 domain-containing protein [Rhizorhabdus sp.]
MVIPTLTHFPVDPAFGTGIYRRRLRFAAWSGGVAAQVSDTHHGYWLDLRHNRHQITAIEAAFLRAPTYACAGAAAGLEALVGVPLDEPAQDILTRLPAQANCTHLGDLALWAIAHIGRSAFWDIEIPDQSHHPVWITIAADGRQIHRWQILDHGITAPEHLSGRPLMRGFARWAHAAFDGDALLAATMLQRGIFVARGRQHIVDRLPLTPLADAAGMEGMCWAYSGDRLTSAHGTIGYVRDFTDTIVMDEPPEAIARRFREIES